MDNLGVVVIAGIVLVALLIFDLTSKVTGQQIDNTAAASQSRPDPAD